MARRPEAVPAIAVSAAADLGFEGVAFRVLEHDSMEHRLLEGVGLDDEPLDAASLSFAMSDAVLARGETVVAGATSASENVPLPVASDRFEGAVGCPVWVLGWVTAVLVGMGARGARISETEVEAMELIASQAGLTLSNARRIELERGVTASIEEGDRLKTEFLTTISHEMRTPLTVLMGNGRTLETGWDALDDQDRQELVAAMNANVGVLDRMVTDLLDHSRLEAGELWVSFEPFDISAVVRRLCEGTTTLDRRTLRTEIEPDLLASGDVVLIRRTASNLLRNALSHTPELSTVTVSCRRLGSEIEIAIADDGPGIADRDLPYVGERFFRGGAVTKRPKGLGLGLALARGILELHDSALVVENDPGNGVRFSFRLPLVADPSKNQGSATAYAPPDDGA
jgi:signal transduction histidine kinase